MHPGVVISIIFTNQNMKYIEVKYRQIHCFNFYSAYKKRTKTSAINIYDILNILTAHF